MLAGSARPPYQHRQNPIRLKVRVWVFVFSGAFLFIACLTVLGRRAAVMRFLVFGCEAGPPMYDYGVRPIITGSKCRGHPGDIFISLGSSAREF